MQKLVFINGSGNEIDLTSGNFGITNWEGFSNTSLNIQSQQVPFQDGGVFLDALMEQRELSVTLAMNDGGNLETRYRLRRELIHALNPKLGEGYLIYTNNFTSKRIKCVAQIPLFETHNSNDSGTPKASLVWTACEPYWEDLEDTYVEFDINDIPKVIENNGDVEAKVEFDIYGSTKNPTIENISTNQKISYNGTSEECLYINTNVGKKEVLAKTSSLNMITMIINGNTVLYSKKIKSYIFYYKNRSVSVYVSRNGTSNFSEIKIFNIYAPITSIAEINNKYYIACGINNGGSWSFDIYVTDDLHNEGTFCNLSLSYEINKIIYSKRLQLFIGVGNHGLIITSSNGTSWTTRTSGVTVDLYDIIDSDIANKLICVGNTSNDSVILNSSDGTSWSNVFQAQRVLKSISEGNGVILTNYYKSYNGVSWDNFNYGISGKIGFVKYLNKFLIAGEYETIVTTDGSDVINANIIGIVDFAINEEENLVIGKKESESSRSICKTYNLTEWTMETSPSLPTSLIKKDGYFYGYFTNMIVRSKDLLLWEEVYLIESEKEYILDIYLLNNMIVVAGRNYNTSESFVIYSDNIENWNRKDFSNVETIYGAIYSERLGKYIIIGREKIDVTSFQGIYITSEDFQTWSETVISSISEISNIVEANGFFIINGYQQSNPYTVLKSFDLVSWVDVTLPGFTYTFRIRKIFYIKEYDKIYLLCSYSVDDVSLSLILTSENGNDWTIMSYGGYRLIYMAYSKELNKIVFVGSLETYEEEKYTRIAVSYDGENLIDYNSEVPNAELTKVYADIDRFIIISIEVKGILTMEYNSVENAIQNITEDSNMNLGLKVGGNTFLLRHEDGSYNVRLKFRQKYIGV